MTSSLVLGNSIELLGAEGGVPSLIPACAGAIFLAKDIQGEQPHLGVMDISVERNAFGRQIDSFTALLEIEGLTAEQIGTEAAAHDIVLHELSPQQASLEEAFMVLTRDEVEFQASTTTHADDHEGALAA